LADQIDDGCGGDLRAVDARAFPRRVLGEQRVHGVCPPSGQQIFLRKVAAPQDGRHFDDEQIVFDEAAARGVEQRRPTRHAFRDDPVAIRASGRNSCSVRISSMSRDAWPKPWPEM